MTKQLHRVPSLNLIRTRLTLWIALILLVGMLAFVLTTFVMAQSLLQQQNGARLAAQTAAAHTTMHMVLTLLYSGGGIMLGVVMLLVWLLIRRMLHPLEYLAASASQIAKTSDHALRLQIQRRPDEITSLARTINGMLDSLEEAYRSVQDTNDLQRRFLADVSHELRTPLTIMLSSMDLMKKERGGDLAFQADALENIRAEAERMARLVTRLLMLARTDATAAFAQEPLLIVDIVREVCQQCRPADRTITVDYQELATLDDAVVLGNIDYLKQVLFIVLENAHKYTPSGGKVTIHEEIDERQIHIFVADTGIGIAAEDLPQLFQRFYRATNARMLPGMGLGLSIARSILDQHHGAINVESTLGQGSRFRISLPLLNG